MEGYSSGKSEQTTNIPSNETPRPRAALSTTSHITSAHDSALELSLPEPAQNVTETVLSSTINQEAQDNEEEEELFDDNDSAFGGSIIGCDTDSLSSFITDYKYENGRRYHRYQDGDYWGPNDDKANEIQDLAHHMYMMTLDGKLHLAPIDNPHNIMDVGTGTGIWAIEMADAYPSASVIGTDLSPIQPVFVPPNCAFEIEDLNRPWTYPKSHFDFIHIRELFGCVVDWDEFFAETYSSLKPGGYVEILEHSVWPISDDGTVNKDSFFTKWGETVTGLGEKFGKSFTIWEESKRRLEDAGFEDVTEVRYKWPMNPWPSPKHRTIGNDGGKRWEVLKELGRWNQYRLYNGIESFMIRLLTSVGGWSYEASQVFLAEMRTTLRDQSIHAYLDVTVVYGRRPGGEPKRNTSAVP